LGGFFSIEKIEVDIDGVEGRGREEMWSRRLPRRILRGRRDFAVGKAGKSREDGKETAPGPDALQSEGRQGGREAGRQGGREAARSPPYNLKGKEGRRYGKTGLGMAEDRW
jgi:hypothetical protein